MIGAILLAAVVQVSSTNPRYFETADGKPWIPIGCNICFDRRYDGKWALAELKKTFPNQLTAGPHLSGR